VCEEDAAVFFCIAAWDVIDNLDGPVIGVGDCGLVDVDVCDDSLDCDCRVCPRRVEGIAYDSEAPGPARTLFNDWMFCSPSWLLGDLPGLPSVCCDDAAVRPCLRGAPPPLAWAPYRCVHDSCHLFLLMLVE